MAVVATGFFDGVHTGHQRVIRTLVSASRERGEEAIVVTFANHPRAVLQQDARSLRLLTSPDEKKERILAAGVDRVEVLDFTREFAAMTAGEYLRTVVRDKLGGRAVLLGYDNRLGSDSLLPDAIRPVAESLGMEVLVIPPLMASAGRAVSSTLIRKALAEGEVEAAAGMLGYEYSLYGAVVPGKQYGRVIGFPTANMQMYDPLKLVPAHGVYLTEVETLGRHFYGMTNVGPVVETHIFDFSEDIYGLGLRIKFKKRLRDERRFNSGDELKAQLTADEETCRALVADLTRR